MAWVTKLCILVAVLTTNILTEPLFIEKGDMYTFKWLSVPNDIENYYLYFRSSSSEERMLLWNSSNPLPENSSLVVELNNQLHQWTISIYDLSQSDSGQYIRECWRNGQQLYQESNDVLVCNDGKMKSLQAGVGETVELQCEDTSGGDDMTIRWYKCANTRTGTWVQLVNNSSSLSMTNVTLKDLEVYSYRCVVLDGELCVSIQHFELRSKKEYLLRSVGQQAVLYCRSPDEAELYWTKNYIFGDVRLNPDLEESGLNNKRKSMYVTDGKTTGNYSLVFPSLTLNQSATYSCRQMYQYSGVLYMKRYDLLVCPKAQQFTNFFSEGAEVVLSCNCSLTESVRVVWYRRTAEVDDVILDTEHEQANLPKDLNGRIKSSDPHCFLDVFNLSLADSGEYWCAVVSVHVFHHVCVSFTKTVLMKQEPSGVDNTFYRVYSTLMGCALLGMVSALITVKLKTRRKDQTRR